MDNLGKLYFRKYYLRMLRLTVYYMLRSLLEVDMIQWEVLFRSFNKLKDLL